MTWASIITEPAVWRASEDCSVTSCEPSTSSVRRYEYVRQIIFYCALNVNNKKTRFSFGVHHSPENESGTGTFTFEYEACICVCVKINYWSRWFIIEPCSADAFVTSPLHIALRHMLVNPSRSADCDLFANKAGRGRRVCVECLCNDTIQRHLHARIAQQLMFDGHWARFDRRKWWKTANISK